MSACPEIKEVLFPTAKILLNLAFECDRVKISVEMQQN